MSSDGQPAAAEQGNDRRLLAWMLRHGLRHPWRCLLVLAGHGLLMSITLAALTATGLNFDVLRHAIDPSAPEPRWRLGIRPPADWSPLRTIVVICSLLVAAGLVRAMVRFGTAMAQGYLVNAILTRLRDQVYDRLQRLSFSFLDANQTGSLINRGTADCSNVATFMEFALVQVLVLAVSIGINLIYMTSIHVRLTLVCLATTPLLAVMSAVYSKRVRPAYEENRRLFDDLVLRISENAQGHHAVKGFALEQHEIERFRQANDALRHQQRWLFRRAALYNSLVAMATQTNLIVVLLFGGWLVIRNSQQHGTGMTVGELIVFAALLQQFSNQVASVTNLANTLQASLTAARRVREVLEAPLTVASPATPVRLPAVRGHVVFEHVDFQYPGRSAKREGKKQTDAVAPTPVLHDVCLEIRPGQCVAILGATGSGKSTLLSLIPRFYDPTRGRITLDGHDLRHLDLDQLRRSVGIVFQESFLFSNTVAFNIAYGKPDATREQVVRAAKLACAHEFIEQLPLGYDTVIGEFGASLSGGQRQRLAIARAILPEPPILLLDDATAAVDPETEREIHAAMDAAMAGRTTLLVAHRLSTLRQADMIVVIDRGRIVDVGTHDQLVRGNGHYTEVAQLQVADAESRFILQARRWFEGQSDSPMPEEEHW